VYVLIRKKQAQNKQAVELYQIVSIGTGEISTSRFFNKFEKHRLFLKHQLIVFICETIGLKINNKHLLNLQNALKIKDFYYFFNGLYILMQRITQSACKCN